MSNRIDRYFQDLARMIEGHIPEEKRTETLRELQSHVEMSVRDRSEAGIEGDEAERTSLAALGSVKAVAEDLIRQHTGVNTKPIWQLAWLPCLMFLVYGTLPILMERWAYSPWLSTYYQWSWAVPSLILLVFCVKVWRTRRWLFPAMAAAILLNTAIGVSYSQIRPFSHLRPETKQSMMMVIHSLEEDRSLAQRANPPHGKSGFMTLAVETRGQVMGLPYVPVRVPFGSQTAVRKEFVANLAAALPGWQRYRQQYLTQIDQQLALQKAILNGTLPPSGTIRRMIAFLAWPLLHLAVMGLANLAVLALATRRRRRYRDLDPHLA